ncbi:MAG TPA: aldehyde dehydrogenase [Acidobacteriaceae bacterium]|jgi:acyl-CoA reductase-like NAD-dependent aldehyde dehydrogenase|nr:aldehyde dehydrogenase [Acidobacteriaceae bacterium]
MRTTDLLIGGRGVAAHDGATFDRVDSYTGEVATRAAAASIEDAAAAADAAGKAFAPWSGLTAVAHRERLNAAADALVSLADEFVAVGVAETGGTVGWYRFNVMLAASMLREAASMTTQINGDVLPSEVPGSVALALRRPCGVVLGIAPWNAPVILGVRAVAMALACGNTVVLKASEICPGVHRLIGTAFEMAGLGEGVVNVITNAPQDAAPIVERLIAHPAVRRVNFTGSTAVGRIVAGVAARYLKPVLLELGGKAPLLVLEDADLDAAAAAASFGAFANQGQICMSTERILVDERVADAFAQRLAAKAKGLRATDPRREDAVLGALVSRASAHRIEELIGDAIAKGARQIAGGAVDGVLMQPTVLDGVTPEMKLYREESFGPVVVLVRTSGEEEAIRIANEVPYGLAAAVFSRDMARALAVAERIESGICHINGPTVHDEANMPFGGVKDSGYGRFGGRAAIAEFTDLRWITLQTGARHYPF